MTSHVGRLYALAGTLVVFFVLWAAIATHPWTSASSADHRLTALAKREQSLRREAALVNQIVAQRAALQRAAAARQQAQTVAAPAPAPKVRVVTLPPLTITRTS